VRGDDLPAGVDLSVFDFGVNAGPRRSVEMLQSAVGVDADGDLGPISMAAISAASPATVVASLSGMQRAHYESLDTFDVFGAGWLARNERRLQAATALIPTAGATA
jgi:lysozyme family protein